MRQQLAGQRRERVTSPTPGGFISPGPPQPGPFSLDHRRASDERELQFQRTAARATQTEKVRVAIVGVGNCASSFVQGVEYYKDADPDEQVPGLMHVDLGGYHVRDIKFTAAFDIDADKVGKDLSEAIWAGQNNTLKFSDVPHLDVAVHRGMTHDGLGKYLKEKIQKAPGETADIARSCGDARPTCWSPTCRSAPRRRPSGTSSRRSRPAAAS